ncbi:MAG TPA: phosphate signaling complex protein PhoU [Longimicrobiales bacterium]|nr:phosphate signaling complex protein PhoU [Longimicrobiales bacterium]
MTAQRHFHEELDRLQSRLVGMAGLAEEMVRMAVEALHARDAERAAEVIERDSEVDALEVEIDDLAIQLLALQQPMARDLRFITMAMKISNDLERVGDHAVNIAEEVEHLLHSPAVPALPEIEEMVRISTDMLSDALDAFIRLDTRLARSLGRRDDRVDELHANVFRILLTHMMEDPRKISAGMDLFLVSRNLERIADLATNIAEDVVFLVEGRNIRHRPEARAPEPSPAD